MKRLFPVLFLCLLPLSVAAQSIATSIGTISVEKLAGELKDPWAVAILPKGQFLISEKRGVLLLFDQTGERRRVSGVPKVVSKGQGGLLDVVAARDFATTGTIFMTFAKNQARGVGTTMVSATLDTNRAKLSNVKTLFEMQQGTVGGRHFGSRVVEGRDGFLYVTVGERGDRPSAQDLNTHNGSVVRVARDGRVPASNPFVSTPNAQPEIWSFGHRNPQGAALDSAGLLWVAEHGAKGGDEVNRVKKGANFGWPVISYGEHYSGRKIGEGTSKSGMEQPNFYWDPSIAPSGLMIYSGKMFAEWEGDFFIGSLKFDHIARLDRAGNRLRSGEQIKSRETARVRDVREAPDGSIWFLSVDRRGLFRISR
ncbi:PQQ-dependent sugar dehydrogenase [Amylibacter sp. IMCC11727]|uniref:PQQ-dependent sugar dehydrogenase n=1 Tax=Amylibacter sp. IMCC11727 TaxID=3039851 RepID=UPI00244DC93F|nr:PQQ-dependent sugar dehydrogenase [Amylibacter sp. IMCC11727]WGI22792.1 PQQ-dependent sugar dehydrogenase [Amylibacter sp. IMCC11727]